MVRTLVLVLGDQLSPSLSSLRGVEKSEAIILMAEVATEATYVRHHKKKIAFVFSAMRHFAEELRRDGWQVDYRHFDNAETGDSLTAELDRAVQRHDPDRIILTEPGEWRLLDAMKHWQTTRDVPLELCPDDRFIASHEEFAIWAKGRKQLRMEYFYRDMRRKTGLLMAGDQPEGGKWNYDTENRKPASANLFMPEVKRFLPDDLTKDVLQLVADQFSDHFGMLEPFWFAVTQDQAKAVLEHFIGHSLPHFGDYQDAMLTGQPFLYHSLLSLYINVGLLDPLQVCRRVEAAYYDGHAPLNAAEGYIRQIIGWREYVRGIYWHTMPGYVDKNALNHNRPLPDFYWTGETDMTCLREAITQTRDEAYAHHIQRLMVTGNFALLAGIEPKQVHEWYLAVYADAYEWVELPNTLGMSQFADGGLLGSKPYVSSGTYINKMSDYCQSCRYKVSQKTGEDACPFNALYWDFLIRHQDTLQGNPRISRAYHTWQKMGPGKRADYLKTAERFLADLA